MNKLSLIDRLASGEGLTHGEYLSLITELDGREREYLRVRANEERERVYGRDVYIRGLIEVTSFCKNDCYYCGIRASNRCAERYRLTAEDILTSCEAGYSLGFRTFVLQGGEDGHFTDEFLVPLIHEIKKSHPDCAVTLSLGERSSGSYENLKNAGADRYLLRHETANPAHYRRLHPEKMKWEERMECLCSLRSLGYRVGCGFMVGSPYQTADDLAAELEFIAEFKPEMCGIGPFIPHKDTPMKDFSAGSVETTLVLLSLIRLIHPHVLLPATTALGTLDSDGRERGISAGANVVMPNLSPLEVRRKYMLYDNKLSDGDEAAEAVESLKKKLAGIGYEVVTARGDYKI